MTNKVAKKAMLVNRVGDFGLPLGIFGFFISFGAVDYATVFALVPQLPSFHPVVLYFILSWKPLILLVSFYICSYNSRISSRPVQSGSKGIQKEQRPAQTTRVPCFVSQIRRQKKLRKHLAVIPRPARALLRPFSRGGGADGARLSNLLRPGGSTL